MCVVSGIAEQPVIVYVGPLLWLPLLESADELTQGLRHCMLLEVVREGVAEIEPPSCFDAGEHDIGPVGDMPPAVDKQVLYAAALKLVTSSGTVA